MIGVQSPAINLIVLRSTDIDKATSFYSALGLAFVKHRHGKGTVHYSCEIDSLVFEIYPLQVDGESSAGARLGFRVESVDAAVAALAQAGARVIVQPKASEWGRRAVIEDLDGHRLELTDAVKNDIG